IVIASFRLAMAAQHIEFSWHLRPRWYVARVGIMCNQPQGFLLAATGDHDRRMRSGGAPRQLRRIECSLEVEVLAVVGVIVAVFVAPHAQADLYRLLQHLKALCDWRVGHPQPMCLILVVTGADAEPGAPTRQHIEC